MRDEAHSTLGRAGAGKLDSVFNDNLQGKQWDVADFDFNLGSSVTTCAWEVCKCSCRLQHTDYAIKLKVPRNFIEFQPKLDENLVVVQYLPFGLSMIAVESEREILSSKVNIGWERSLACANEQTKKICGYSQSVWLQKGRMYWESPYLSTKEGQYWARS